jgi:uncharacterized protein involved in response to NO
MTKQARKPVHAFWLFFPAASILAALVVPLSIYTVTSGTGWPSGLLGAGHGHELIFGFALALIAGYTLGPQPRRVLLPLFSLWFLARVAWLIAPESLIAQALSPAFALLLARYVVPRFNAAKKWRNKVAGPLILLLCILALVFWLSGWINSNTDLPMPGRLQLLHSAIIGLLLLMTFMGGRVIAPAVAGTLEKKGIPLEARVQPRIEGALLLLLLMAVLFSLIGPLSIITGLLLLVSAVLIFIRTLRWRLWHCPERPDLLVLALGYLWLAVGASAIGVYMITGKSVVPALHLITIGALGTLSVSVMLRLAWQRAHRSPPPAWQVLSLGFLTSAAAVARYLAGPVPFNEQDWLWLSAALWCLAYSGVTIQLLLLVRPAHSRRK